VPLLASDSGARVGFAGLNGRAEIHTLAGGLAATLPVPYTAFGWAFEGEHPADTSGRNLPDRAVAFAHGLDETKGVRDRTRGMRWGSPIARREREGALSLGAGRDAVRLSQAVAPVVHPIAAADKRPRVVRRMVASHRALFAFSFRSVAGRLCAKRRGRRNAIVVARATLSRPRFDRRSGACIVANAERPPIVARRIRLRVAGAPPRGRNPVVARARRACLSAVGPPRAIACGVPRTGSSDDHLLPAAPHRHREQAQQRRAGEGDHETRRADRTRHGDPPQADSPTRGRHRPKIADGRTAQGANTVFVSAPSIAE